MRPTVKVAVNSILLGLLAVGSDAAGLWSPWGDLTLPTMPSVAALSFGGWKGAPGPAAQHRIDAPPTAETLVFSEDFVRASLASRRANNIMFHPRRFSKDDIRVEYYVRPPFMPFSMKHTEVWSHSRGRDGSSDIHMEILTTGVEVKVSLNLVDTDGAPQLRSMGLALKGMPAATSIAKRAFERMALSELRRNMEIAGVSSSPDLVCAVEA